jgi:adenylate kinase family enzyme
MQNIIIICGLPGTGKTTLCKQIVDEYGYNYVSDWQILDGQGRESCGENRKQISKKFSTQIDNYILVHSNQKLIIDLDYSALPQEFSTFKSKNMVQMVYLGFNNISSVALYKVMSKKDNSTDLKAKIDYYLSISNFVKAECKKYGLTFYGINKNHNSTLELIKETLTK